ncbi:MAG TPA: hypothetical protein VIL07_08990 [Symbiobacteriaceae bacterium]
MKGLFRRLGRLVVLVLIAVMVLPGCNSAAPIPSPSQSGTDLPTQSEVPEVPPWLGVKQVGDDLELTGLTAVWSIIWSPSGKTALIESKSGWFVLNTEEPSLKPIESLDAYEPPVFWSETEVLWMQGGNLKLRNLTTGEDRLLHWFGLDYPVIHYLRPEDTYYVINRWQSTTTQGHRVGTIVSGKLGGSDEAVLIDRGYLVGRMATGQVLAVEGLQGGPLWALSPQGEKRLLSKEDAHFVTLSPDGKRALWFTGSPRQSSWLDLFKPAIAYADAPYDPPLTDLWIWDGRDDPVRIPLGGTFSVQAKFSPDGTYIALALNEEIWSETPDPQAPPKPGQLAVVADGEIRPLATFQGRVHLGQWLGNDRFQFMPPADKTGAQPPIFSIDLSGEQTQLPGPWYQAQSRDGRELLVIWNGGNEAAVFWSDASRPARVRFHLNERLGDVLYAPPHAPYLPFVSAERVVLRRLR